MPFARFGPGESMWRAGSKPRPDARIPSNSSGSLRRHAERPDRLGCSLNLFLGNPLAPTGSTFLRLGVGTGLTGLISGVVVVRGYADAGTGRGSRVRHANGWPSDSDSAAD